ncbi:MAG TPA: hypothetical protein VJC04_04095 [Candidatus Paceibacterota bacterium]
MKKILIVSFVLAFVFGVAPTTVLASGSSCTDCIDHTIEVVSDTTNTVVGDGNAISVTPHVAWTAVIPGSTTWIWKSSATTPNQVVAFEKSFTIVGTVLSAQLDIATDNSYEVFIDGTSVVADITDNNFQLATQDVHNLTANVTSGTHTLRVEVKNVGTYNSSSNPAGLLYKLVVNSKECPSSPLCCSGNVKVRIKNNNTTVTNNVTTVANTGGNVTTGGSARNYVRGGNVDDTTANGGDAGEINTGNANAWSEITNVVNTNIVRVRR